MSEKRRLPFGFSPELPVFFLEKPKEVRRLDSMLALGPADAETASLDMGPAMDVGG
jgi:hypothetical protein